jgi:hypothetical protein
LNPEEDEFMEDFIQSLLTKKEKLEEQRNNLKKEVGTINEGYHENNSQKNSQKNLEFFKTPESNSFQRKIIESPIISPVSNKSNISNEEDYEIISVKSNRNVEKKSEINNFKFKPINSDNDDDIITLNNNINDDDVEEIDNSSDKYNEKNISNDYSYNKYNDKNTSDDYINVTNEQNSNNSYQNSPSYNYDPKIKENNKSEPKIDKDLGKWNNDNFNWSKDTMNVLKEIFGLKSFRPLQKEAINATMSKKDVFIILPTGGGKSLCYQLPAIVLYFINLDIGRCHNRYFTIVIIDSRSSHAIIRFGNSISIYQW